MELIVLITNIVLVFSQKFCDKSKNEIFEMAAYINATANKRVLRLFLTFYMILDALRHIICRLLNILYLRMQKLEYFNV